VLATAGYCWLLPPTSDLTWQPGGGCLHNQWVWVNQGLADLRPPLTGAAIIGRGLAAPQGGCMCPNPLGRMLRGHPSESLIAFIHQPLSWSGYRAA